MTALDLSHLTISEQLELLYAEGIYLSKRRLGSKFVILYHFRNVYVEIFYTRYRKIIDRILYSQDPDTVDPYLEEIDLDFLSGIL